MRRGLREYVSFVGLLLGVLFFPSLQFASRLFVRQGLVSFWFERAAGSAAKTATSTPTLAAPPDRTRPFAVMIDNHPDARPQSGVAQAAVVLEALVEGGLTRDMAIFRSGDVSEIGPVRSARPYFLEWARGFDAVYTHVGGSDEALADLKSDKYGLDNVDEFFNGSTFWRDTKRRPPHNAYTSTDRLRTLLAAKGWAAETDDVDAAKRVDTPATGDPAKKIDVAYMRNDVLAEFRWDAAKDAYQLWRGRRQALDRDGQAIEPRTVVVLETDVTNIADPEGKGLIGLRTLGSGDATVFRDGVMLHGTWKKTAADDRIHVVDAADEPIPFSSGQVWYSVIGINRGGEVTSTP